VPTIYRRCPLGMQGLVSDGLASLLPHCPARSKDVNQLGSFGRQFMARKILYKSIDDRSTLGKLNSDTPRVSSISLAMWNERDKDGDKPKKRWAAWPAVRRFHALHQEQMELPDDKKFHPLWMKCAEDDVNGLA
jgi:hypothetical protein